MKLPPSAFCYRQRVGFADTDAMGVVHHSVYLRYVEQARVEWMRHHGVHLLHFPHADLTLAVLETQLRHHGPARFDDELRIYVQSRREKLKIYFQYAILRSQDDELVAVGQTILVPINGQLKPIRIPPQMAIELEKDLWTETWL